MQSVFPEEISRVNDMPAPPLGHGMVMCVCRLSVVCVAKADEVVQVSRSVMLDAHAGTVQKGSSFYPRPGRIVSCIFLRNTTCTAVL